jgi:hypothetical protein
MDANVVISLLTLIVSVVAAGFIGYLTFLMLQFTARPRLTITLLEQKKAFKPGCVERLRFLAQCAGYWYARPAATNIRLYVNFDPAFEPLRIRFGSTLEKVEENVRRGKGQSKYLVASGIHLSQQEPGEEIETEVKMPAKKGRYRCWISAYSDQGHCGVHSFELEVAGQESSQGGNDREARDAHKVT